MKKLFTILLMLPLLANAGLFYASPTGSGFGTIADPYNLQSALFNPASIHPGDTIYLLGGTYKGTYISKLVGTNVQPIIVRNNPGDRVVLDGSRVGLTPKNVTVLQILGSYTWYIGLEITNSDTVRTISVPGSFPPEARGAGVDAQGPGIKLINCLIYDTGEGIAAWTPAVNSEYYGNIIFNNGWYAPDREHGPGIYSQNNTGTKSFIDNIILNSFWDGLQIYGSSNAQLNNFYFEGNVCFNDRWLLGGSPPLKNIEFVSNFAYKNNPEFGYINQLNDTLKLRNNFFPVPMRVNWWKNVTATGNTFFNYNTLSAPFSITHAGSTAPDWTSFHLDSNTYYTVNPSALFFYWQNAATSGSLTLPQWQALGQDVHATVQYFTKSGNNLILTGKKIFIRPNKYDVNRWNIIIYNWDKSATVNVGSVLNAGDQYELHNVQNYFGDVITGIATDSLIVPMTGHTVAKPLGYALEIAPSTFPEFGVFELIRKPVVAVNQCHNIDSLITLVSIMQGQMIGLQASVDSALARINALEGQTGTIAALQAALTALQTKVSNLKAITTIQ